jgi:hypothetical protein
MSSDGGDHAGSDNEEEPEYDLSMVGSSLFGLIGDLGPLDQALNKSFGA